MEALQLSKNGIPLLLEKKVNIVVQIQSVVEKLIGGQRFFKCEISDGFCRLPNCLIVGDQFNTKQSKPPKDMSVINITKCNSQESKKNKIIIIENFNVVNSSVNKIIGEPIPYETYVKNGKTNPLGRSQISTSKPEVKKTDNSQNLSKNYSKKIDHEPMVKVKREELEKNQRRSIEKKQEKPSLMQTTLDKPKKKNQGPIEKKQTTNSNNSRSISKPNSIYTLIKNLYLGIDNWVIYARVIMVQPLRQIMTKKGVQSCVMTIQIADSSGTIECTMFGDTASKYEHTFTEDNVVQISDGWINQSTFDNKKQLKISINDKTKINFKEDDPDLPYIEDLCKTIDDLVKMSIGNEARVVCLINDTEEPQTFVSKAGKQMTKKIIQLMDPVNLVKVQVTLWNQKANSKFQKIPYIIKSVRIGQYNGNKQYNLKNNFYLKTLPKHNYRRYVKDINSLKFTTDGTSNAKVNSSKQTINTITEINNSMDIQNSSGVWAEVICYVSYIKANMKSFYLSCPHCRKKVPENDAEETVSCFHCNKNYEIPRPRYILSMMITDKTDSMWITAYDEAAEIIMGTEETKFTAPQFIRLNDEEIRVKRQKRQFQQVKLKLLTKIQQYQGDKRKKTSIIKVMDLDYGKQARNLLQKLNKQLQQ